MEPRLGVPIAMDAEALCILGARQWRRLGKAACTLDSPCGIEIVAIRSGVGLEKGLEGARRLVSQGIDGLVSVGLACGLRPDLRAGDLVVGSRIVAEGSGKAVTWESSPGSTEQTCKAFLYEGIPVRQGTIVSVRTPLSSPDQKTALYRNTHALASDMESSSVARAAMEANLPFLAMRVIVDDARKKVAPDLSCCLDMSGKIRFALVWRKLCRKPSLAPELLLMTKDLLLALSILRRAWAAQIRHALPGVFSRDEGCGL